MLITAEAVQQDESPNFVKKFSLEIYDNKAFFEWNARGGKNIATARMM